MKRTKRTKLRTMRRLNACCPHCHIQGEAVYDKHTEKWSMLPHTEYTFKFARDLIYRHITPVGIRRVSNRCLGSGAEPTTPLKAIPNTAGAFNRPHDWEGMAV